MTAPDYLTPIKQYFHFLFEEHDFAVTTTDYDAEHFGNWIVTLSSPCFRIMLIQDRGSVLLNIGSHASSAEPASKGWFGFSYVLEYMTDGKKIWEPSSGSLEPQLKELSQLLRPYVGRICNIFEAEHFPVHKKRLDQIIEHRWKLQFPNLSIKKLG